MKSKILILVTLGVLGLSLLAHAEIVDDHKEHLGYALIKQLYDDTGSAIEELDTNWGSQNILLTKNIHSWTKTVVDQESLCARRKGDLQDTLKEIDKT